MLVLTRKPGESAVVYRAPISSTRDVMLRVEILSVRGAKVRLGFDATREFIVDRFEVLDRRLAARSVSKPTRVLIFHDDSRTRLALTTALRAMGLEVEPAANPSEAIEKAVATKPEVLMVTLAKGLKLVEKLRSRPELAKSTLVALAEPHTIDPKEARELGFSAVLPPNPDLEQLQQVVSLAG